MNQFSMTITVNYPEDEKEYEAKVDAASYGKAIDSIMASEVSATSFVFVISRGALDPAKMHTTHAPSPVDTAAERA